MRSREIEFDRDITLFYRPFSDKLYDATAYYIPGRETDYDAPFFGGDDPEGNDHFADAYSWWGKVMQIGEVKKPLYARNVQAHRRDLTRQEFYSSGQKRAKPTAVYILHAFEYDGEEYLVDDTDQRMSHKDFGDGGSIEERARIQEVYHVVRTYHTGDVVELTVEAMPREGSRAYEWNKYYDYLWTIGNQ